MGRQASGAVTVTDGETVSFSFKFNFSYIFDDMCFYVMSCHVNLV